MDRKTRGCRRLAPTDTSGTGPGQTTAERSPGPRCEACGKGGHKTENCAGGEDKRKPWGLAREQGASLEQELVGNAFATSGTTYHSGQGRGTPTRGDWKRKMGTEERAKELRAMAKAKTGPCPVCKEKHEYQRRLPWRSLPRPTNRLQECKAF